MKQFFLPLGLILAVAAAFFLPAGGHFLAAHNGVKLLICTIFLVSGYQTGSKGLPLDRRLLRVFLIAALISLFLAPAMGVLLTAVIDFPATVTLGLLIITAVPPTISSGIVITEVSRGNTIMALFLTLSLNLLGIFIMPFTIDLALNTAGPIDIDQTGLLLKMLFLVLLPFVMGKLLRHAVATPRISARWSYVNSSCVALVVYSSLTISKGELIGLAPQSWILILAAVAVLHGLLLAICALAGRVLCLQPADQKAMVFVTSQKTLAIGLAVLASIGQETGHAIIVCLLFHFVQLFIDSFLAGWWQKGFGKPGGREHEEDCGRRKNNSCCRGEKGEVPDRAACWAAALFDYCSGHQATTAFTPERGHC